ncbi:hypothetical protein kam1_799 [Methylacidiphilum kamchatkense Kam1]|uniref:Large ribosomal subunit protein uL2 RNA-binding domain-containing protein n=1 Tax=Methylacidiphilum kamchatkense Kam1 TaxID=1202785 RepID=A0A516TLC1_9BACT|nr:hypothetical protein [Methylacidiphilum kamchatkense]QDQ42043.1 hypothetical protein kam1_799 [Methylacidiphilum kamchatkense Kam1]
MGIKSFRPLTPTLRFTALDDFSDITNWEPEWSLTEPYKKTGGRNNYGRVTARHRGGGISNVIGLLILKGTSLEYQP